MCWIRCAVTRLCVLFFFFNDTATTEIYTLSLHDALPIYLLYMDDLKLYGKSKAELEALVNTVRIFTSEIQIDRKSTRLNSSHTVISYAVFCLKKKTIKVYQEPG